LQKGSIHKTDRSKFSETQLPPIECFYNALTEAELSTEDYTRAQEIWNYYRIENL